MNGNKFHFNKKTGAIEPCSATKRACPNGGEHFSSVEEAESYLLEQKLSNMSQEEEPLIKETHSKVEVHSEEAVNEKPSVITGKADDINDEDIQKVESNRDLLLLTKRRLDEAIESTNFNLTKEHDKIMQKASTRSAIALTFSKDESEVQLTLQLGAIKHMLESENNSNIKLQSVRKMRLKKTDDRGSKFQASFQYKDKAGNLVQKDIVMYKKKWWESFYIKDKGWQNYYNKIKGENQLIYDKIREQSFERAN